MDDALYDGFGLDGERSPTVPVGGLGALRVPGQAPPGIGRAPGTAMRMGTASNNRGTTRSGLTTGMNNNGGGEGMARPMTSVAGAGFSSKAPSMARFMDASAKALGPAPPLLEKVDNSPTEAAKDMEKKVHQLLESSAEAVVRNEYILALERAKEAGRKERALSKYKEANNLSDSINMELTYAIVFNLANAYHLNKMYQEALNTYTLIIKNKQYANAGKLRVNIGNIHYEKKEYPQAIKMYRMALDQIPTTSKDIRMRILRNIGNAHVRMGAYQDAITTYETIMDTVPDIHSGFHLLLCYFALGDTEYVKRAFERLLQVPLPINEEEEDDDNDNDDERKDNHEDDHSSSSSSSSSRALHSPSSPKDSSSKYESSGSRDALKEELMIRQKETLAYITTAAKLIAPMIGGYKLGSSSTSNKTNGGGMVTSPSALSSTVQNSNNNDWIKGYDWVIEQLKIDHSSVASELQICKALEYLHTKQFDKAIDELKTFEKKDVYLKAKAATNLSFIYFLENDTTNAAKYADLAVRHDRYNAKALVNLGNSVLENKGELERAKELYLEAIGVEADCVEAIFNLGLVNRQLGIFSEALQAFEKLHTIIPSAPEVLHHIASLHEQLQNYEAATKYFQYLLAKVPSDTTALNHLGQVYVKNDDENQAYHFYAESYRYFPVNLDVISWLGVWFVKAELYEKAIEFFERASEIQPKEVKWRLMVASCYRRMGSYATALDLYEEIHISHPDNLECLRYLVALCKEMHRRYDHYEARLIKLERTINASNATMGGGGGALTRVGGGMYLNNNEPSSPSYGNNLDRSTVPSEYPHPQRSSSSSSSFIDHSSSSSLSNPNNDVHNSIDYSAPDYNDNGNTTDDSHHHHQHNLHPIHANSTNNSTTTGATSPGSRGFGTQQDRFIAPTGASMMGNNNSNAVSPNANNNHRNTNNDADDFADADLDDLLTE